MRGAAILLTAIFMAAARAEPTAIAALDVDRYLGRWYEIASFPMFFQRIGFIRVTQWSRCAGSIHVI
ncbi:MAG: lipocalin family protein, partial [Burkholderiales bacterium]|nr:lipocalin family protein [Burkholderiales bacterium]